MTSRFWSNYGSLMFEVSPHFPRVGILRLEQVDHFEKHETLLKPRIDQAGGTRVTWSKPAEGVGRQQGKIMVESNLEFE